MKIPYLPKILGILLCALFSINLIGQQIQSSFQYPIKLCKVTFHSNQASAADWILLKEDPSQAPYPTIFTDGQNISETTSTSVYEVSEVSEVTKKPVAYVSGTTGRVSARLSTDFSNVGKIFFLSAEGPDGFSLPTVEVRVSLTGIITYPETDFEIPFPMGKLIFSMTSSLNGGLAP